MFGSLGLYDSKIRQLELKFKALENLKKSKF